VGVVEVVVGSVVEVGSAVVVLVVGSVVLVGSVLVLLVLVLLVLVLESHRKFECKEPFQGFASLSS
jgi:Flp pilus assembly protein TadB